MSCKTRLHSALPWTWRLTVEGGRWGMTTKEEVQVPLTGNFWTLSSMLQWGGKLRLAASTESNQTSDHRTDIKIEKNSRYNNFKTKITIVCLLYHNTRHRRMGILITNQHVLWNDIMLENICWSYKSLLVMGFLIKNQCALEWNRVGKYLPFEL